MYKKLVRNAEDELHMHTRLRTIKNYSSEIPIMQLKRSITLPKLYHARYFTNHPIYNISNMTVPECEGFYYRLSRYDNPKFKITVFDENICKLCSDLIRVNLLIPLG